MTKAPTTKKEISQTYKKLVTSSHSKLPSVKEIAESCNISRKTFYYHFQDINRLILWTYRFELAERLKAGCEQHCLVFPHASLGDCFPELPYYARQRMGVRSIDGSAFYSILGSYLQENKVFYKHVLETYTSSSFLRYIVKLYQQATLEDIWIILGGRKLPAEVAFQLTRYFTYTAITSYFDMLVLSNQDLTQLVPDEYANINHQNLYESIERYFLQDKMKYSFAK